MPTPSFADPIRNRDDGNVILQFLEIVNTNRSEKYYGVDVKYLSYKSMIETKRETERR